MKLKTAKRVLLAFYLFIAIVMFGLAVYRIATLDTDTM